MIELFISTTGLIRTLYDEALPLRTLGTLQIERASHVEPDADGNWSADLRPCGGPVLGPFVVRSLALQAERDWLLQELLSGTLPYTTEMSSHHDTVSPGAVAETADARPAERPVETSAGRPDISERPAGDHS